MEPVIVPYDEEAERLLRVIAASERPATRDLRRLQQYVVTIPRTARAEWVRLGALRPVHPALTDGLLTFADTAHYRAATGLDLAALGEREAVANIL